MTSIASKHLKELQDLLGLPGAKWCIIPAYMTDIADYTDDMIKVTTKVNAEIQMRDFTIYGAAYNPAINKVYISYHNNPEESISHHPICPICGRPGEKIAYELGGMAYRSECGYQMTWAEQGFLTRLMVRNPIIETAMNYPLCEPERYPMKPANTTHISMRAVIPNNQACYFDCLASTDAINDRKLWPALEDAVLSILARRIEE